MNGDAHRAGRGRQNYDYSRYDHSILPGSHATYNRTANLGPNSADELRINGGGSTSATGNDAIYLAAGSGVMSLTAANFTIIGDAGGPFSCRLAHPVGRPAVPASQS